MPAGNVRRRGWADPNSPVDGDSVLGTELRSATVKPEPTQVGGDGRWPSRTIASPAGIG